MLEIITNNLYIIKILLEKCTPIDAIRLSQVNKAIHEKIISSIHFTNELTKLLSVQLDLINKPQTPLNLWYMWKKQYITVPSCIFDSIANRDYFQLKDDKNSIFGKIHYLPMVWWLEAGCRAFKDVPVGDYQVYWRIKIDFKSKPIMFHSSVKIDGQTYVSPKLVLDDSQYDEYRDKWILCKTNKISLPKQILDRKENETMTVKCMLFNIDSKKYIRGLNIDYFQLVPSCVVDFHSNDPIVELDEFNDDQELYEKEDYKLTESSSSEVGITKDFGNLLIKDDYLNIRN